MIRVATSKTSFRLCETSDDREALVGEALDEVEDLARLGDAERGGRLVEDDELGVPLHRLGHRDGLPLASRERGDGLTDRADGRDRE